MPFKHYGSLCCLILSSTILVAQTDSLPNLKGRFIVGGIDGRNYFRVDARENITTGNVNFSNSENHYFQPALGYGFYYGNNKALTFELNASVNFNEYSNSKSWSNIFGASVSKMKLKNIFHNKWFVLADQRLYYNYSTLRGYNKDGSATSIPNPFNISHTAGYRIAVGALYKHNNTFTFRLTMPIVNISTMYNKSFSSNLLVYEKYNSYNYNTSFYYSISNIQLSVLWSPSIIQSKKNKQ